MGARSHVHDAAPRTIRLAHALDSVDDTARGEIGCLDMLHQRVDRDLGIVDEGDQGVTDFGNIVRWNLRRHTDSDTIGTIAK
jgi:hypothetical protein